MNLKRPLLMAFIFTTTTSISLNQPTNHFQAVPDTSFLKQANQLAQPIIIPNLTSFAESLFPTAARSNHNQNPKTKNDINNYFIRRIFYPGDSGEASEESAVRTKFENDSPKPSESSERFSSKYSSKSVVSEDSKENSISSNESEEARNESEEKLIPDSTERVDSSEDSISRSDIIQDEVYKTYSENPYPTHSYFEDEKPGIREYSKVNEPRETEDSEISPTTNEPYTELRRSTSFPKSHYPDEELGNYETQSTSSEERDTSKEEESDSSLKNYHSIQTPLEDIKYRGSYDDEYEKTRTRLDPISRHPISHNWPYSKAHLKVGAEKLNKISDSDEREDSDLPGRIETNSKLSELERAAKRDESELRDGIKYNYTTNRGYRKETPNLLSIVEDKDHQTPFFQSIKQYKVEAEEEEEPRTHPTVGFVPKPQPQFKISDKLWSTSSSLPDKGTPVTKLFSKHPDTNKLSHFNITKELTDFQGHLGPVVFAHEPRFETTTKPHKTQTPPPRNIFLDVLTKKEEADRKNLPKQIIAESNKNPLPSFSYQKESDEMYNQILASIQSVFRAGTQSKSATKSQSEPHQELAYEENKSFTWAVPLRKRDNVNQDSLGSPGFIGSKSKEKSGSEGKSGFPSDIL